MTPMRPSSREAAVWSCNDLSTYFYSALLTLFLRYYPNLVNSFLCDFGLLKLDCKLDINLSVFARLVLTVA